MVAATKNPTQLYLKPGDGMRLVLQKRSERVNVFFPVELLEHFDAWIARAGHADRTSAIFALVIEALEREQQER